jgi:hypothetical protein
MFFINRCFRWTTPPYSKKMEQVLSVRVLNCHSSALTGYCESVNGCVVKHLQYITGRNRLRKPRISLVITLTELPFICQVHPFQMSLAKRICATGTVAWIATGGDHQTAVILVRLQPQHLVTCSAGGSINLMFGGSTKCGSNQ